MSPSKPSSIPKTSHPYSLIAVFTAARMTALRPGQSPPPVRIPMRWIVSDMAPPSLHHRQVAPAPVPPSGRVCHTTWCMLTHSNLRASPPEYCKALQYQPFPNAPSRPPGRALTTCLLSGHVITSASPKSRVAALGGLRRDRGHHGARATAGFASAVKRGYAHSNTTLIFLSRGT